MFGFEGPDRRKEEERVRNEGRLPPGQSLTLKFPVLHYGPVPRFNPAAWDFRVWGEVEEEKRWSWDEFNKLPRAQLKMDIHCVTRRSKFDTVWEGISVRTLDERRLLQNQTDCDACDATCRIWIYGQSPAGGCVAG